MGKGKEMTTIAYKDGILATDSRLSSNGSLITDKNIKAIKTKKYLVAASGDAAACDLFLKWARDFDFDEDHRPEFVIPEGDFEGMQFDKHGDLTTFDASFLPVYIGKVNMYTSGSGGDIARGAMLMGADVVKAIELAKTVDMNSGGDVQIFTLIRKVRRKRKPIITRQTKPKLRVAKANKRRKRL